MYKIWQYIMAQSPCFLLPLPIPSLHPSFTFFYLLGNPPCCDRIPSTLVPGYSWTDLPFLNPFPFLPIPNSQYPSQISPASHANKDDGSTPASEIRNRPLLHECVGLEHLNNKTLTYMISTLIFPFLGSIKSRTAWVSGSENANQKQRQFMSNNLEWNNRKIWHKIKDLHLRLVYPTRSFWFLFDFIPLYS